MEQIVPWSRLITVVEPYYPKSGKRGRPPIGVERMLRMYFIQQWYGLADVAVEDAIYDSQALRNFCGIDLTVASVPDSTTLMDIRPCWKRTRYRKPYSTKSMNCSKSAAY